MKSGIAIQILCGLVGCCYSISALANNITVSAISLSNRNSSTQTVRVNCNLTWDNSWRTTSAPFNWDAAWVFVKYKVGATGEWKHATLATSGHTIPSGATSTQTDATGIFIYRSAPGTGSYSASGIQLQWNYGSDGVSNDAKLYVKVFAIEMVYNPPGGFQAGSGAISNGEFRKANDITSSGTASTFTITGTSPTLQGNSSSSSPTNMAAYNNNFIDLTGTATSSLATGFPTGFNAFYSMKYEISQQQYVDFLNTLTYTQQAARTATAPNSAAGTGALSSSNVYRNGIDIQTPGTVNTLPAIYACNLNGNGTFNESDDGQHIACNYLSWDDLAAYLDWAALRPMTELEFEKACRGNQNPLANEYAWGNTSATALSGLNNSGSTNEIASNAGANIIFNNVYSSGPVRTGIFASSTSNRNTSGAGYYGNMELSGNLWERVVTIGNATGRTFSASNGNGNITSAGAADVTGWVSVAGTGFKGGSWQTNIGNSAATSDRLYATYVDNTRYEYAGGRGIRNDINTIVGDGLQVWLDAGISTSYSGTGTTWTDLSGNNYHGTLINGTGFNSANGGSMQFDGTNDYVSLPRPSSIVNGGTITICLFAKWVTTGTSISTIQVLVDNNHTGTQGFVIQDRPDQAKILSWGGLFSTYQVGNGNWVFIAVTQSSTTTSIYLNGSLHSQTSLSGGLINVQPNLYIGGWGAGGRYLNGNIGNVMIYNRALSASEISQNFTSLKSRFGL